MKKQSMLIIVTLFAFLVVSCSKEQSGYELEINTQLNIQNMSKSLTIPEDYTIDNSRPGTITDNGDGTGEGSNVTISEVANALGEDTHDLSELCLSSNLNRWAAFSPYVFNVSTTDFMKGDYKGGVSAPYNLGDFIGYSHHAKPPVYWSSEPSDITVERFMSVGSIKFSFANGEADPITNLRGTAYEAGKDYILVTYSTGAQTYDDVTTLTASDQILYTMIDNNATDKETMIIDNTSFLSDLEDDATLYIKPYYYYSNAAYDEFTRLAMIEDGERDIPITVVNPQFSVSITGLPIDGADINTEYAVNVSIIRYSSTKEEQTLYFRIRTYGDDLTQSDNVMDLGSITLEPGENYTTTVNYEIVADEILTDNNKTVYLDASPDNTFNDKYSWLIDSVIINNDSDK